MKNGINLRKCFRAVVVAVLCLVFSGTSRASLFEVAIPEALRPKIKRVLSVVLKRTKKFGCTSEEICNILNRGEEHIFSLLDEAPNALFEYNPRGTAKLWVRIWTNRQRCRWGIPEEKLRKAQDSGKS